MVAKRDLSPEPVCLVRVMCVVVANLFLVHSVRQTHLLARVEGLEVIRRIQDVDGSHKVLVSLEAGLRVIAGKGSRINRGNNLRSGMIFVGDHDVSGLAVIERV